MAAKPHIPKRHGQFTSSTRADISSQSSGDLHCADIFVRYVNCCLVKPSCPVLVISAVKGKHDALQPWTIRNLLTACDRTDESREPLCSRGVRIVWGDTEGAHKYTHLQAQHTVGPTDARHASQVLFQARLPSLG